MCWKKKWGVVYIYEPETSVELSDVMGNASQIKYDRTYDHVFDNSKLLDICGETFEVIHMQDGLKQCLSDYLDLQES